MNKFAKILSAVIAVVMALSMITLAFAANDAAVSLNLVEDKAGEVVLSVKLDKGEKIGALEVMVTAKGANIGACTAIDVAKDTFDSKMSNTDNGMIAVISADGFGAGADVATYTFAKIADEAVSVEDFEIAVKNCANADLTTIGCDAVNKLPAKVTEPEVTEPEVTEPEVTEPEVTEPEVTEPEVTEPEVTEPEVTEPEVTEPEVTEPEVTEPEVTEPEVTEPEVTEPEVTEPEVTEPEVTEPEVTEPEVTEPEVTEPEVTEPEVTEPEATEPSTEDKTDAPAEDDKTDAPAADDKTEAPSTGDVVNPDTGDSATATAAIVSLLAVSGAALVALRKKED